MSNLSSLFMIFFLSRQIAYLITTLLQQNIMSQKPTSNNSAQLKNQINNLTQARQGIQKGNDISGSMVKLNKTLTNIKPMLKKQQNYIKNFFTQQQPTNGENKQSQNRRLLNRVFQVAMNDINDLLDVSQNYFTIDFKNSWTKIKNQFQKQLNAQKQQIDSKNLIQFVLKIINVKDYFAINFMKSIIYRKCTLWKDLNINQTGYIHNEKKQIIQLIEDQMIHKGYVPTKPVFNWMGLDVKGNWNMNKFDMPETDLKNMYKLANQSIEYTFSVLRNYGNLTLEQRTHQDIDRNKDRVKSLRQQIEDAKISYMNLEKKYRQAVLKDQKSDIVQLKQKVSLLEEQLESKENQLKKIKFQFRDSSNEIHTLKEKIKQLETDLYKINNQQMKKLKELETVQNNLNDEFSKIYKNVSNFGSMFEFESDDKKSLAKQIMSQTKTIEKLVEMLGKQKQKTRNLGQEMVRLNNIILQLGKQLGNKR